MNTCTVLSTDWYASSSCFDLSSPDYTGLDFALKNMLHRVGVADGLLDAGHLGRSRFLGQLGGEGLGVLGRFGGGLGGKLLNPSSVTHPREIFCL